MAIFNEVLALSGVYQEGRYLVVPLGGINFFILQNLPGCNFKFQNGTLEILPVSRQNITSFTHKMQQQYKDWGIGENPSTKAFIGALNAAAGQAHAQLYVVTGKIPGGGQVRVIHNGREATTFYVDVLRSKSFTLAFKFVSYQDTSKSMQNMTKWKPSDKEEILRDVNQVYGPQANISFTVASAEPLSIEKPLGNPLSKDSFDGSLVPAKNIHADLNLFFLDKLQGNTLDGFFMGDSNCIAISGDPERYGVTKGSDPFVVTLAHEVGHFLERQQEKKGKGPKIGDGHLYQHPDVLMSSDLQSARVDRDMIQLINSY